MFFLQQSLAQKVLPACENLFPSCWKCQDNPCNNKVNIWFLVHAYALKNLQFTFIENHCKEYLLTYRNTAKPWLRYRYMYKSAELTFSLGPGLLELMLSLQWHFQMHKLWKRKVLSCENDVKLSISISISNYELVQHSSFFPP